MQTVKRFLSHNFGLSLSTVITIVILFWTYGCQSTVKSLLDPTIKVNREELAVEVNQSIAALQSQIEVITQTAKIRISDLDKQDEIKAKVVEVGLMLAKGGTINPAGIAFTIAGILGIGAVVDNRTKDKVIKTKNNGVNNNNG